MPTKVNPQSPKGTIYTPTQEKGKRELGPKEVAMASQVEKAMNGISDATRKAADGTMRAGRFTARVLSRIGGGLLTAGKISYNVGKASMNTAKRVGKIALPIIWDVTKTTAKYTGKAILGAARLTFIATKDTVKAATTAGAMAHLATAALLTVPFSKSRASELFAMAFIGTLQAAYGKPKAA